MSPDRGSRRIRWGFLALVAAAALAIGVELMLAVNAQHRAKAAQTQAEAAQRKAETAAAKTLSLCRSARVSRIQGNARSLVLREFLLSAAQARERSAASEQGSEAAADRATAARYRHLRTLVHQLAVPACGKETP